MYTTTVEGGLFSLENTISSQIQQQLSLYVVAVLDIAKLSPGQGQSQRTCVYHAPVHATYPQLIELVSLFVPPYWGSDSVVIRLNVFPGCFLKTYNYWGTYIYYVGDRKHASFDAQRMKGEYFTWEVYNTQRIWKLHEA